MSSERQLQPAAPSVLSAPPGDTPDFSIRYLLGVISRNRFLIIASFLVIPILSGLIAALITPVYQASLSMRIDEKKSGLPVLEALSALSDQAGELNTEMEMLRSRTLAEQTVDSLALQVTVYVPRSFAPGALLGRTRRPSRGQLVSHLTVPRSANAARYRLTRQANFKYRVVDRETGEFVAEIPAGALVSLRGLELTLAPTALEHDELLLDVKPFEKTVASLSSQLAIRRPQREANFVTVRYQTTDPELAAQVPNVLAANFLALRNLILKTEARSTVRFLREQIDTLSRQVAATEDALRAFREGNQVVNLSAEASVRVTELTRLQGERSAKVGERDALSQALSEARQTSARTGGDSLSAYRSLIAFPTLIGTNASQFLQALNDAENQRSLLLQRRTRQDRDVQILTARIRELEQQLTSNVQTYLSGLTSQIASLDAALAKYGQQMERIPSKEMQFVRLERQNKVLADIYMLLQTRLQEAQIAQATEDSRVRVVDAALVPTKPIKPDRLQYIIFGALIGLAIGLGLALMRETLDRTVHSPEDMVQLTGVASLGIIPHIDFAQMRVRRDGMGPTAAIRAQSRGRSLTVGAAGNPITEAYRTLRTNITYSRPEQTLKTLVFTSPTPGDGKSTTAANLASTLAHQGHRVVLIDGDMRRGTLHQVFGISRDPGLSNALVGLTPLDECIHHIDLAEFGTLDLIPSGVLPPNPSELFGGRRMIEFIKEMELRYDVVLFDSPPVTLVTDAAILGTMTNGVVLISRAGHTDKGALAYAAEQLRNVRAPIIGTVLNDFDFRRDIRYSSYGSPGYYYASYGYGYGKSSNGYDAPSQSSTKKVSKLSLTRLRNRLRVGRTDDSEQG